MKVKWITLAAMAMTAVFLATTSGFAGKVIFEDKFATLDPSWGSPGPMINVKDGKLIITGEKNLVYNWLNQANVLPNDMDVSYTMSFIKAADPAYGSGLIFWARDTDSWYALLINANGWFGVQRLVAGRYLLPVAWHESDAVKKGEGQENQVRVVTKGNQASISINGKEVVSFSGQPPEGGSLIGFRFGSGPEAPNIVAFSNLQVVQP